jgi:hypothetical protein
LAGQLQKMGSFYFLAMTTDIHAVLTHRTLAKRQVKCNSLTIHTKFDQRPPC